MDIKKELQELKFSDDFGNDVIKQVRKQKEELEKAIHILKVVSLADKIEKLVATDLFNKDNIDSISICCEFEDHNNRHIAEFSLIDENGEIVANYYDRNDNEQAAILCSIFDDLDEFDFDLASSTLRLDSSELKLQPGIKEDILKLFLNIELKKVYDYNNMDVELPINEENNSKKLKM